jgi:hypothetical protein
LVWNIKTIASIARRGLLKATVVWLPFGSADNWLIIIGWWEVIIGICFLFEKQQGWLLYYYLRR